MLSKNEEAFFFFLSFVFIQVTKYFYSHASAIHLHRYGGRKYSLELRVGAPKLSGVRVSRCEWSKYVAEGICCKQMLCRCLGGSKHMTLP